VVYRVLDADWPPVEIAAVWAEGSLSPGLDHFLDAVRRLSRAAERR
jgi:hypothetical protein